ncbi:hypothetical protein JQX13_23275 [Archangium violaceum]|uniref:hypothetical protein n=1 Tax=Archangium violaceum TaxID=83451 RepID=UPI00193AE67F|nr:hypothetical protein [Archangium violaceum]QRK14270.1 hypothetical protein JQX13_23275 [Archangium violaceum]
MSSSRSARRSSQAAHLEAASVWAFLRLREELALHGADEALRDAALAWRFGRRWKHCARR